ncbi:unnamed protein product [marine sediment metagenome]|uniref:Uncharacterized protein n=1 Tax=marine sediment metagenome TaxID=412755 RepID=X0ZAH1_9ZZZZ
MSHSPTSTQLEANQRLSRWFKKERARLLEFTSEPGEFLSLAEGFYEISKSKVVDIAAAVGCDEWTDEHWQAVLNVSGCQPGELRSEVDKLTQSWPTILAAELSGVIENVRN